MSSAHPQGEETIILKLVFFIFFSFSVSLLYVSFFLSFVLSVPLLLLILFLSVSLCFSFLYFVSLSPFCLVSAPHTTLSVYCDPSGPLCLHMFLILILCLSIALLPCLCPPISGPTLQYLSIVIHLPSLWIDGRLSVVSYSSTGRRNHNS